VTNSRPPSSDGASGAAPTIPALDTLRAVAALAVVTTHVAFQTGTNSAGLGGAVLARLDVGVAIFFVLSGFLLSREFLGPGAHPDLRAYAVKRLMRIYPVYVVAVVLAMTVIDDNRRAGAAEWLRQLSLTQIYWEPELPAGLTQMWSLSTEVAFYAVLPPLAVLLVRLRDRHGSGVVLLALAGLSTGGLVWQAGVGSAVFGSRAQANLWLPGYALWFCLGICLALAWHRRSSPPTTAPARLLAAAASAPGACWLGAAALLLVAATPVAGPTLLVPATGAQQVTKSLLYAGCAGLLILPLALGDPATRWARWLASRPLRFLGHISYSLFCVHLVVVDLVFRSTGVSPFTGQFLKVLALTVVASIALAAVVYRVVERPAMRWGRRIASRPAPIAAPREASASS
jgi:peptidoglycan/LPS O-acetylase OafA/YrhL